MDVPGEVEAPVLEARVTPLEHLEQLARDGWHLEILHHEDRSQRAPEPIRKIFTVTARRVTDDVIHAHHGRAETLSEAIERTAP